MKNLKLLLCIGLMGIVSNAWGQSLFWTFDDNQTPVPIPEECEARFDEIHGGVFMPTVPELLENGKKFLSSDSLTVNQQGAYCIVAAALQNDAEAQYILAQIYEKGRILPQDDLSAYKWAFIAALNGKKEAENLTLLLEQFLTTPELEKTTSAIEETRKEIAASLQKQIDEERERLAAEKEEKGSKNKPSSSKKPNDLDKRIRNIMPDVDHIFKEEDRLK